jgi:hypothetical protein
VSEDRGDAAQVDENGGGGSEKSEIKYYKLYYKEEK